MFSTASIFPTVVPQTTPTRPDGMSEAPRQVCVSVSSSEDITKPQKLDLHFVRPRTPFLRVIS